MAGHTACHRMDGIFDRNALFLEQVGHFPQHMLCLGDGHAIAGNDDDLFCLFHQEGSIVCGSGFPGTFNPFALLAPAATIGPEATGNHRQEFPVHRAAHDIAEDRARAADKSAGDDHRRIAEREAHRGGGPTRIAVEHRHHDRHVCAANRDDQQEANREGQAGHDPEQPGRVDIGLRDEIEIADQAEDSGNRTQVDDMPTRQQDRRTRHVPV